MAQRSREGAITSLEGAIAGLGLYIDASRARITTQGDVFSHNTVNVTQVVQPPPKVLTVEEKEDNLIKLRRCPMPASIFTGREEALSKIRERLVKDDDKTRVFVLYGLGGAGKSQIAYKFVYTHCYGTDPDVRPRIPIALFIDASTEQTIKLNFEDIAIKAGIGESAEDVLLFLPQVKSEWLILFDNADDSQLNLRQYFPRFSGGNILITTRNARDFPRRYTDRRPASSYEVASMTPAEAVALLRLGTGDDDASSDQSTALAEELGHLPLAITQAAAAIQMHATTIEQYRRRLSTRKSILFKDQDIQPQLDLDGYTQTVYTTWRENYSSLSPMALSLFNVCAFMHHDGITEDIFVQATAQLWRPPVTTIPLNPAVSQEWDRLKQLFSHFQDASLKHDSLKFANTIAEIRSHSLMQIGVSGFSIHPLVHTWTSQLLGSNVRLQTILLLGLSAQDPTKPTQVLWRQLVPHLDRALKDWEDHTQMPYCLAGVFGCIFQDAGKYQNARALFDFATNEVVHHLGNKHYETVQAKSNLASILGNLGQHKDAEVLQREVLGEFRKFLGEYHPETVAANNSLSVTLLKLGIYTEAETLQREVLEKLREILGEHHLQVAIIKNNLALTLNELGMYRDAEVLQREALADLREGLGEHHPEVITMKANLALILHHLGRYKDAEVLLREVLVKIKEMVGEHHPYTTAVKHSLASTLVKLGMLKDAEVLQREVLAESREMLGEHHPETMVTKSNLATVLDKLGKHKDAEALQREILEDVTEMQGRQHPMTLAAKHNLAMSLHNLRMYKDAETLLKEVLIDAGNILGRHHRLSLTAKSNLAWTYNKLGLYKEAEALQREVLADRSEILGEYHPDTVIVKSNLAWTLRRLGMCKDAEALQR